MGFPGVTLGSGGYKLGFSQGSYLTSRNQFSDRFRSTNPNLNSEEAWKLIDFGLKIGPKRLVGVIAGDEMLPNYIGDHNKPWNKDPYETTSSSQISSYIGIIKNHYKDPY